MRGNGNGVSVLLLWATVSLRLGYALEVGMLNFEAGETIDWTLPPLYVRVDFDAHVINVGGIDCPLKDSCFKAFAKINPFR